MALENSSKSLSWFVWFNYHPKQERLQECKRTINWYISWGQLSLARDELKNYIRIAKSYRWQAKPTKSYLTFMSFLSYNDREIIRQLNIDRSYSTPFYN
jgi:hypothetical protein